MSVMVGLNIAMLRHGYQERIGISLFLPGNLYLLYTYIPTKIELKFNLLKTTH